jgi:hypothetical protein
MIHLTNKPTVAYHRHKYNNPISYDRYKVGKGEIGINLKYMKETYDEYMNGEHCGGHHLNKVNRHYKDSNYTFEQFVCHIINHEVMHKVLEETIDVQSSVLLDKILFTFKLREYGL